MPTYIFLTLEGYTYLANSESIEPDVENLQMLGIVDGTDAEDAWRCLLRDNEWITEGGFTEAVGYELAAKGEKWWVHN